MKKKLSLMATTIMAVTLLGVAAAGAVSADAAAQGNMGTSGIPRSVFQTERLDAVAKVLNTSPSNIQTAHKDKTISQLIKSAGLTKETFHEKVKAQLTADLQAQGYSQSQITIALQHRNIERLHHEIKKDRS